MTNSTSAGIPVTGNVKYSCNGVEMIMDQFTSNGSWGENQNGIVAQETSTQLNPNVSIIPNPWAFPAQEISNLILYSVVFIIAVVGNILVITTLRANPRMRTVANIFLLNLAISDLLLAIVCMPITLTGRILKKFVFGRIMCKVLPLLMGSSVFISTFTMLAISVERYYAICKPLKSRTWQTTSHAYKVIIGIWITSCLLSLPYAIISDTQFFPLIDYGRCTIVCRLHFTNDPGKRAWYLFLLLVQFCIPGFLMTIAYTRVSCRIWREFKVKALHPKDTHGYDDEEDTSDGLYIVHRKNSARSLKKLRSSMKKLVAKDSHSSGTETTAGNGKAEFKNRNVSRKIDGRADRRKEGLKAKKKVVRMLIVIVILFFVCWTPLSLVNVWKAFDPATAREKLDGIIEIIQLMTYASTCVNPLVYCFMNKRFRSGFIQALLLCVPGVKSGKWTSTKRHPPL